MRYEDCPRNHGSACVNCSYGIDEDTKYFLLNVNEIIYVQLNKFGIFYCPQYSSSKNRQQTTSQPRSTIVSHHSNTARSDLIRIDHIQTTA